MSLPKYREYKDSGIAWLGDIPAHWEVRRLKTELSLITEKTDRRNNPVALENIKGWSGNFIHTGSEFEGDGIAFERGDILFGKLRPYLAKVYLANVAGEAVGDFHVLRPSSAVLGNFAQYQILTRAFIDIIDGSTFGSKMPRASWESLANMPLVIAPVSEQVSVIRFLSNEAAKIDALISEQEKLITLLAEKRQATISHAVTKGLNPNVPMKDSGVEWLGKVPEHWRAARLKLLFEDVKAGPFGSALTKDMYVNNGYRVYGQEQVIPANFSIGDYYINQEKFEELQQYSIRPNDILISCVGTFGKIAIVPVGVEPGVINPRLIRIRVIGSVLPQYLTTVLRSSVVFEQFSLFSRGGTMDVISIGTLSEIIVTVPPIEEQRNIIAFLNAESSRVDELSAEALRGIALLKERRSALISAAVTGKIDVRQAVQQEQSIQEAA